MRCGDDYFILVNGHRIRFPTFLREGTTVHLGRGDPVAEHDNSVRIDIKKVPKTVIQPIQVDEISSTSPCIEYSYMDDDISIASDSTVELPREEDSSSESDSESDHAERINMANAPESEDDDVQLVD